MNTAYVVELESGIWVAPWDGDPPRTCRFDFASRFGSTRDAMESIRLAREFRPFRAAKIVRVDTLTEDQPE